MSSIRRFICNDLQTQNLHSTFISSCDGSLRTIFCRFWSWSGWKSGSLSPNSLLEDCNDLWKQKCIFLLASVSLTFVVVWWIVFLGEIYFIALWWLYEVTSVFHWDGSSICLGSSSKTSSFSAFFPLYPDTVYFSSVTPLQSVLFDWLCKFATESCSQMSPKLCILSNQQAV